jgi:uncharacterized membrane protein
MNKQDKYEILGSLIAVLAAIIFYEPSSD